MLSIVKQLRTDYGSRESIKIGTEVLRFHVGMISKSNKNRNPDAVAFWCSLLQEMIDEYAIEVEEYGEGHSA